MCVFERERARTHTCMQRESAYRARERGTTVLHASKEHQKERDTALAPVIIHLSKHLPFSAIRIFEEKYCRTESTQRFILVSSLGC